MNLNWLFCSQVLALGRSYIHHRSLRRSDCHQMGRQGDFLFIPFYFCQIVISILNRFVKLASQWSTTRWLNNILLRHKWVYSLLISFHFWPFSFSNIWSFSQLWLSGRRLWANGRWKRNYDGLPGFNSWWLFITQAKCFLTDWGKHMLILFFCHEIVWSRRIIFFLSASYEGSFWICWIVMLWCTNSNKFLIIVIQLKLIEKHWIMFNNLLTISSQLQEGGSLGGSVMEDYSPHGRDSRLTSFTRILYFVLFLIRRTFV